MDRRLEIGKGLGEWESVQGRRRPNRGVFFMARSGLIIYIIVALQGGRVVAAAETLVGQRTGGARRNRSALGQEAAVSGRRGLRCWDEVF